MSFDCNVYFMEIEFRYSFCSFCIQDRLNDRWTSLAFSFDGSLKIVSYYIKCWSKLCIDFVRTFDIKIRFLFLFFSIFISHFLSHFSVFFHCRLLCVRRLTSTDSPKKTKKSGQKKSGNGIKCVVVGDEKVGKTNLILSYLQHRFTTEHVPTASDIYNCKLINC